MDDWTLTASDRCNACGAAAQIRAWLTLESELLFCAHHGHKAESSLRHKVIGWVDESARLAVRLDASA